MKKKIVNDIKINLFVTFLIAILGFLINKYFAQYMGMQYLGLMKLFTQLITYLSLAELGLGTASSYALYKPLAEKNINQINIIISTIDSFYKKIAVFILVVGILFNLFLKYFIKEIQIDLAIHIYWTMYVINISIGYCFAKYVILFTANQEYGFVRKVQGAGKGIFQLLQIFSLVLTKSFYLFILLLIVENLFNFYIYKKHFTREYNYLKKVKQREIKIIKDMKNLFWHKLGWVIVHNTDYIILSKFVSISIVGIYSSYLVIYQMIIMLIDILTGVLNPKIGKFISENSKEENYAYWKELYYVYLYMAVIFVLLTYKLIIPFMKLWLGEEYVLPKFTVALIMVKLFIHISRIITIAFKDLSGFYKDTYTAAIESIINLVLSLGLVREYQLDGVLIGTIISNIIVMVFLKPILIFKECFDKKIIDYLKTLISGLMISLVSFIVSYKILDLLKIEKISNWVELVTKASLSGIIIAVITAIIFFINPSFRKMVKTVLKS